MMVRSQARPAEESFRDSGVTGFKSIVGCHDSLQLIIIGSNEIFQIDIFVSAFYLKFLLIKESCGLPLITSTNTK